MPGSWGWQQICHGRPGSHLGDDVRCLHAGSIISPSRSPKCKSVSLGYGKLLKTTKFVHFNVVTGCFWDSVFCHAGNLGRYLGCACGAQHGHSPRWGLCSSVGQHPQHAWTRTHPCRWIIFLPRCNLLAELGRRSIDFWSLWWLDPWSRYIMSHPQLAVLAHVFLLPDLFKYSFAKKECPKRLSVLLCGCGWNTFRTFRKSLYFHSFPHS